MPNASPTAIPAGPTFADFASFYLYGFAADLYRQTAEVTGFGELYNLVVGAHGGLGIAGSFHPYQLVGPGGITVWYAAYAQFYAQPNRIELFGAMTLEQARFVVAPPASFAEFHVWPDTRLTARENPVFGQYVPFVLPFLVRKSPDALRWDAEVAAANGDRERLGWYREAVTEAIRFVQPAPALVLGFGEFDEQHPERLVEQFLAYRALLP